MHSQQSWDSMFGLWQTHATWEVSLATLTTDIWHLLCGTALLTVGAPWWFHSVYGYKWLPGPGVMSKVGLGIGVAVLLAFIAALYKMVWISIYYKTWRGPRA